jgi:hypothetical protein
MQKRATKTSIKGHNMAKGPDFEKQEPLSAGQIGALVVQLARMARTGGLETLAHILDMAALEAETTSRRRSLNS